MVAAPAAPRRGERQGWREATPLGRAKLLILVRFLSGFFIKPPPSKANTQDFSYTRLILNGISHRLTLGAKNTCAQSVPTIYRALDMSQSWNLQFNLHYKDYIYTV